MVGEYSLEFRTVCALGRVIGSFRFLCRRRSGSSQCEGLILSSGAKRLTVSMRPVRLATLSTVQLLRIGLRIVRPRVLATEYPSQKKKMSGRSDAGRAFMLSRVVSAFYATA